MAPVRAPAFPLSPATQNPDTKSSSDAENIDQAYYTSRKAPEGIRKHLSAGKPLTKMARTQLEKMIEDYADTDLARDAQELVAKSDQAG